MRRRVRPGKGERQPTAAQRDGSGSGRVYTLHYTAADVAGNTSACDATVKVPHDQGT